MPQPARSLAPLLDTATQLQRLGRHSDAVDVFARCLEISPADASLHFLAGVSLLHVGRLEQGVAHMRVAAAAQPHRAEAWSNLGLGLRALRLPEQAREAARRALALDADLAHAWNVMGLVERDAGAPAQARAHFERALYLEPRFAEARMNLAACEEALGRIEAALAGYDEAAALDPSLAEVPYHRGHLHHHVTGDLPAAIRAYREAIVRRPDYSLAHHNLAEALFLVGDFGEAWQEHRWRAYRLQYERLAGSRHRRYTVPSTLPARIIVVAEQGLGDTLFFLRFVPLLRARGAVLSFAGDVRLHKLLARAGLFEDFAADAEDLRGAGAVPVLAGDLSMLASEEQRGVAHAPLVLTPDASRIEAIRERLVAFGPAPYFALAWRSGTAPVDVAKALYKEVEIPALAAALASIRATWICVQRDPRASEIEAMSRALGAQVHDLSSTNIDLEDALAVMAACDEYVGVSSTNVHLRAGVGHGARVLVPFPPEWRWMSAGDSRWFPKMRVYRQDRSRSWTEAFARLARDLATSG